MKHRKFRLEFKDEAEAIGWLCTILSHGIDYAFDDGELTHDEINEFAASEIGYFTDHQDYYFPHRKKKKL